MITVSIVDRFLSGARGQALREGTRYAHEARVGDFVGSSQSVSSVVRGRSDDFEVALWEEREALQHRCSCPSWRDPCKHQVAAALVLRQWLTSDTRETAPTRTDPETDGDQDADIARTQALEERQTAARREKLSVRVAEAPYLVVRSPSGFSYRVRLRGGPDGPHSCDCPDFEANRLHTCKHVERVRAYLRAPRSRLERAHRSAAMAPRVYLHFGEVVEPRLHGTPSGRGSSRVRDSFDADGRPLRPLAKDGAELQRWLATLDPWAEPEARSWLEYRTKRRPLLPDGSFQRLLPRLGLKPYPYQWTGAEFLARTGRALLADEMGLGKTVQAILAAVALRQAENPVRAVTIVCPASLRGGWQDEIRRWIGEDATPLEGRALDRGEIIASRPRWLVTHYEQVLRDHRHHEEHPPDLLIVDEAQRAKGLRARTARVLKTIGARHVFALTGTPLENRLEEAYAIAQLIDQRLLPPLWQLDRDHFVREDGERRVALYRGLDALRSKLAPAFLRRRKEDVALELPERVRSIAMVPMHVAVVETYDEVMSQVVRIARKKVLLPADLERMQRLLVIARRCCDGPQMLKREVDERKVPKLQELEQVLRDLCLGEGRKAVVFSEWTDMTDCAERLCRRLRLPVFHLHGGVPIRGRPGLLRSFSTTSGPAVFVSTDAGGVGLNLQVADVVVNLDLPWNPARLEQRVARVHRIGSKTTVQEILMVTKDSVEERILCLHDTKRNVLANIWDKGTEDVIAAPGGSGAFREMVTALLEVRGPEAESGETAGQPTREPRRPAPEDTAIRANATHRASDAGNGPNGKRAAALVVDPAALLAAMGSVAPVLPPEHRKSLASVFRVLAESLEA